MLSFFIRNFLNGLTALLIVCCTGCAKKVIDDTISPIGGLNASASSIRLFNYFGFAMDVSVNNIPLTSYGSPNAGVGIGLSLLPSGAWSDGGSFTIPNNLLDKNGLARVSISVRSYPAGSLPVSVSQDTVLYNDPLHPVDYYMLSDGHYHAIGRSPVAPTQATGFKIRVINLGQLGDPNSIEGPVTVTYADGTPVSPVLTGVLRDTASGYVELPYGAYELKVFANGNFTQQLSELNIQPNISYNITTPVFYPDQEARLNPIRVFKPGGIYTLFVSSFILIYSDIYGTKNFHKVNAYRVVSENSPSVNYTYAKIQGVNGFPAAGQLHLQIDGQPLGDALDFGQHTDYSIQVKGLHTVAAYDATGKLIVEKDITLYPYDNICAWVYMKNDSAEICFSAMDMSTVGTNLQFNCLNLCSGLPYLTLANDVTLWGDSARTNLPLGQPVLTSPYAREDRGPLAFSAGAPLVVQPFSITKIRAFQSDVGPPVTVPGSYLEQVAPLYPDAFVVNPAMYPNMTPKPAEPGAYTVALIGKLDAAAGDPFAPKMIVVKHNK